MAHVKVCLVLTRAEAEAVAELLAHQDGRVKAHLCAGGGGGGGWGLRVLGF